jgi:hypothetical protein
LSPLIITLLKLTAALAQFQICGQSQVRTIPKIAASYIVGGEDANPGDFPWQVNIYFNMN